MNSCCCFIGPTLNEMTFHNNESMPKSDWIKSALSKQTELLYKQYGVRLFWIGGSLGVDIWAAEAIIKLKTVFSDLN